MRTKLVVVTGVAPLAMDSTLMTLAWDLPQAVSVRHRIHIGYAYTTGRHGGYAPFAIRDHHATGV